MYVVGRHDDGFYLNNKKTNEAWQRVFVSHVRSASDTFLDLLPNELLEKEQSLQ